MRFRFPVALALTTAILIAGALPTFAQGDQDDPYAGKTPSKKTLEIGGNLFTKKVEDVDPAYGVGIFANYKLPWQKPLQLGLGIPYASAGAEYTRYDEDWSSYSFWFGIRMLTALNNVGLLNNATLNAKLEWIFDWGLGFGYCYFPGMEYSYYSPCGEYYTLETDAEGKLYWHFHIGPAVYDANTDIFLAARYGGNYYFDELSKNTSLEHKLLFSLGWMIW